MLVSTTSVGSRVASAFFPLFRSAPALYIGLRSLSERLRIAVRGAAIGIA